MTSKHVLRSSSFSVWQRWNKDDEFTTKKKKKKNWQKTWINTSQIKYSRANNHMKRCSAFLVTRKMQVKTKMRYHCISIRLAKSKNTDNTKWWWGYTATVTLIYNHCEKLSWQLQKNITTYLPDIQSIHPK